MSLGSTRCGQSTLNQPNGHSGVGHSQGRFSISVTKRLNFSCGRPNPGWLLGQPGVVRLARHSSRVWRSLVIPYWTPYDPHAPALEKSFSLLKLHFMIMSFVCCLRRLSHARKRHLCVQVFFLIWNSKNGTFHVTEVLWKKSGKFLKENIIDMDLTYSYYELIFVSPYFVCQLYFGLILKSWFCVQFYFNNLISQTHKCIFT